MPPHFEAYRLFSGYLRLGPIGVLFQGPVRLPVSTVVLESLAVYPYRTCFYIQRHPGGVISDVHLHNHFIASSGNVFSTPKDMSVARSALGASLAICCGGEAVSFDQERSRSDFSKCDSPCPGPIWPFPGSPLRCDPSSPSDSAFRSRNVYQNHP